MVALPISPCKAWFWCIASVGYFSGSGPLRRNVRHREHFLVETFLEYGRILPSTYQLFLCAWLVACWSGSLKVVGRGGQINRWLKTETEKTETEHEKAETKKTNQSFG
jgi:hypothetical protein